jgi:hypothetical protein
MIYLNHDLISYKKSKEQFFICKKCDNLIWHQIADFWYYLDDAADMFKALKDCNEIIIKKLLE